MSVVLSPAGIAADPAAAAGGKARVLAELVAAGFPVPPFVVVLPGAFRDGSLAPAARGDFDASVAGLPGDLFAVRSSGLTEDGAGDSHAGQFLTVLDVPRARIADEAGRVFASGAAAGVAAYRAARGLEGTDHPAVIVQAMVHARGAGVAFAADPVSGRRDRVVVCAVGGLADRLVSGEVDGETWMLAPPGMEPVRRPGGASALTAAEAGEVAGLCLRASAARGAPQDIEWAFPRGGGPPFLLQSRPITTALLPAAPPETRLLVLDNSNIVESYPGTVSPLTFSFAAHAYDRVYRSFLKLVGVPDGTVGANAAELGNMLSLVDGRMFYNLGNWYRLLSLLPFFSSNRAHMESMMGVEEPLPPEAMEGGHAPPGFLPKLRMAAGLATAALRLQTTRRGFMLRLGGVIPPDSGGAALEAMPLSALATEYRRIEAALLDRWDAPIVNDFLCMMAFGASRKLMGRWCGAAGIAAHNDAMIGQGDIVSAEPARLILAMGAMARGIPGAAGLLASGDAGAAFALPGLGAALQAYVARFGDRRVGELKLEQPTLADDPSPLLQAVAATCAATPRAAGREPAPALAELFAGRPVRRIVAAAALGYAKARVRDRENLRFERTRIFGHARRVFRAMGNALAAGGVLRDRDDVFFLTVPEVLGAAEGNAATVDLAGTVALRRAEHDAFAAMPDPGHRVLVRGSVADRDSRVGVARAVRPTDGATGRTGTPCGGGRVSGTVRVVRDPFAEQVLPGEILVARHTDPGWISHFVHAAAVVVERGSVLSHSAIVSRELGIPCVVAVRDACSWLATGDRVTVDGGTGLVRKDTPADG